MRRLFIQCLCLAGAVVGHAAETAPVPGLEFFEQKVRPVLSQNCFPCHSGKSEKLKAGLRLDSRARAMAGGESLRPAVTPGHPESSQLVEAIGYGNPDLQMPPKAKLSAQEISDLTEWIRLGAPWPAEPEPPISPGMAKPAFDLAQRKSDHWAWQPVTAPTVPKVQNASWAKNPVDRFLLAQLEAKGLAPAPEAEKRTRLRRVYFDLIGLPPSPREMEEFVADVSPGAWEKVVDRLLANPHFGERWARHWLDLVRYAETLGHEFDYANFNAWRYRDYVIRALNADLPYDQLVREHLAGDLILPPRRDPLTGMNESVMGTAFFWLGQREHSPVDVRFHEAEVIDNQIDVLSKAFLGLTVACARCHDHKFDAISARDYYALFGVLESSRYTQAPVDDPAAGKEALSRLEKLKPQIRRETAGLWRRKIESLPVAALVRVGRMRESHPRALEKREGEVVLADFSSGDFSGWSVEGNAFGTAPARAGDFIVGEGREPVATVLSGNAAHSGVISRRLEGGMRSESFLIQHRYVHALVSGRVSRISVPVDNLTMIRDPIYGGLRRVLSSDVPRWMTFDLGMWMGQRAHVELMDSSTADGTDDAGRYAEEPGGWLAVEAIVLSDKVSPPPDGPARESFADAEDVRQKALQALDSWTEGRAGNFGVLEVLRRSGVLALGESEEAGELEKLLREYHLVEATLSRPTRVPGMTEGSGMDERVFARGNHKTPGDPAPRGFLQALGGSDHREYARGSGRLALAHDLTDGADPLFARVAVNRVWSHLFGRGLVATPDNFGALGERPSHPELLDWLANWFRGGGEWKTKKLIRMLVLSSAYQMSSRPADAGAEERDAENRWWHRMPLRRLEAESIRDAMLSVSGGLDERMFGPPVPVHLTEFMEGRGRPGQSGPVDGAGRRSVYQEVRRNFVPPMMRAFDTPVPQSTVGLRTVSNVPAQSLILMNDPFVQGEARRWARRILAGPERSSEDRIHGMYRAAFGRGPTSVELGAALGFLRDQAAAYGKIPGLEESVWADLAHVLFNVKEFIF